MSKDLEQRFTLRHFDPTPESRTGNYTEERAQLFQGMSVKDIVADIKARRNTDQGSVS